MQSPLSTLIPALTLAVVATPTFAQTAASPPALTPSSPWAVDYADKSCKLSRSFGVGAAAVTITFTKNLAPLRVTVGISGPGLGTAGIDHPTAISMMGTATVDGELFAPDASASTGQGQYIARILSLQAMAGDPSVTASFARRNRIGLTLSISGFAAAMTALNACQDDLYRVEHIDSVAMRSVVTDAVPIDQVHWVSYGDTPLTVPIPLSGARAGVRLDVDAAGRVSRCYVTESSGFPLLDLQTCRVHQVRARFQPARNAAGEAVPTVADHAVRWTRPS